MRRKTTLITGVTAFCLLISFEAITNATGAPGGRNGSPSSFSTCATVSCHSGPSVTSETINITTDIPAAGFEENTMYNITVTADDGGRNLTRMGFQASVEDASGAVGSLAAPSNEVKKLSTSFVTHNFSGSSASGGSKSWSFNWNSGTAPDQSTVYVAVNFANDNGSNNGDVIETEQLVLSKNQSVNLGEIAARQFEIYPNPAADYIEVKNPEVVEGKLRIFDLNGKVVKEITEEQLYQPVNLQDLSAGLYLVKDQSTGRAIHFSIER